MNLLNMNVVHKTMGKGIVKSQDEKRITVEFASKTCSFHYPEVFRNFLTVEDEEINKIIVSEIEQNDAKVAEEKRKVEEARKLEEERRFEELAQKSRNKSLEKPIKRMERVEGQMMTFLVFQGNTFETEYKGGFIWAPKFNKGGTTFHHWDRLLDVRKGDFIIHCANGYVKALSVAKGECYDATCPSELMKDDQWDKDGRMIDCEYMKVNEPVKHSDYKETILKYCNVKYAPFDKDGNGNMGYLYDLNKELAKFLVEKSVINNGYLLDSEYVQAILK